MTESPNIYKWNLHKRIYNPYNSSVDSSFFAMVFSSTLFLTLFFPIVLIGYLLIRENWRVIWLVIASLFFYAWGEPKAIVCMIGMICGNYFIAKHLPPPPHKQKSAKSDETFIFPKKVRFILLILGVVSNLFVLFVYKYLDFFILNINAFFGISAKTTNIALPIGISFYCFQCLSYLVDVYRGNVKPSDRLDLFALYIAFFPALIAGPIVRYIDVYKDLANRSIILVNCSEGFQRFVVGLAKKVLIADPLGLMADRIMSIPASEIHVVWAWVGIFCYALQIFYDFSSYSDMAIGLGRVFNLKFLENFQFPYSADSVQDFWRRWHISLSSWLRDYVYIPLGGSRVNKFRTFVNVWIVFLLCGLWHGASWNFLIWGAWHGMGLTIERFGLSKVLDKCPYIIRNLWVWLFVLIGWVWFRAPDLAYAVDYLYAMFVGNDSSFWMHLQAYKSISISLLWSMVLGVIFAYVTPNKIAVKYSTSWLGILSTLLLWIVAWAFAVTSTFSPFIYFRF